MLRQTRSALACVALFAATLLAPVTAEAGGAVLVSDGESMASPMVRMAIANGPSSTTRWSEITLPAGPAVGWLVPVRPGAAVDWAPNAWMNALDQASAPRVLVPRATATCTVQVSFDKPAPWVVPATSLATAPIALPATAADAEAWTRGHGLIASDEELTRIRDLYASGWRVAAVELGASDARRSSPALRVTDDGGPMLPLSIGAPAVNTSISLFVIAAGPATIAGAGEIDDGDLLWGSAGSNYPLLRKQQLGASVNPRWLRESASHAALFDKVTLTTTSYLPSAAVTYFNSSSCSAVTEDLGSRTEPQTAAQLTCGTRTDLAFALAGIAPSRATLTRIVGLLPANRAAGTPSVVVAGNDRSAVRQAEGYDASCSESSSGNPGPSSSSGGGGSSGGGLGSSGSYPPSSSGTTVTYPDDDGYYGSSTEIYVPSDGCGGSTAPSGDDDDYTSGDDDDDDDGWDSSDSSSDACSGDTSSSDSSSSDSCSSDTSTSSDGWDSSDSSCSTSARAQHKKHRGPSPLSRVVLFGLVFLIPLRRFTRKRNGECS